MSAEDMTTTTAEVPAQAPAAASSPTSASTAAEDGAAAAPASLKRPAPETHEEATKRARAADGSAVETTPSTRLALLKRHSIIVVDSAEVDEKIGAVDATTNPSIIHKLLTSPESEPLIKAAVAGAREQLGDKPIADLINNVMDRVNVLAAKQILEKVPGLVSIEIDPSLAFDEEATVARGRELVKLLEAQGVDVSRVAFKIPATYAGVQACRQMAADGYKVNLTLIFSLVQAVAGAQAKAHLISPFVGRITDYYKGLEQTADPGVEFVRTVYRTLRNLEGCTTEVMGASFRSSQQCIDLSGCDRLTIPPAILSTLLEEPVTAEDQKSVPCLTEDQKPEQPIPEWAKKDTTPASVFHWELNEDEMATRLLSDGIRKFYKAWLDSVELVKKHVA